MSVVRVGGEIDLVTVPALEQAIDVVVAESPAALVIDLSGVEFLGSVGLKILAATHEKLGTATQFGVVARGPATRRPIHLTGLDKIYGSAQNRKFLGVTNPSALDPQAKYAVRDGAVDERLTLPMPTITLCPRRSPAPPPSRCACISRFRRGRRRWPRQ